MRGSVTGFKAGDKVKVWFEAGGKSSDPFTFTASAAGRGNRVLVLSAEDYSGLSPNTAPFAGPAYLATYTDALADAGIPADVYDIDAQGRTQADLLGILSHYKAVVWYTSLDDYVRDPGQTHRRLEDVRRPDDRDPRLHQRGRQGPRHRPARAAGRVVAVLLQPARARPGQAAVHVQHGRGRDRPARELRAGLQRLPAVLDGRVRPGHAGVDRGHRGRADDRRRGAVHELLQAHRTRRSCRASRRPRRRCRRRPSRRSPTRRRRSSSSGSSNAVGVSTGQHAAVGLRPGEHRRPRDAGDGDPPGPRHARRRPVHADDRQRRRLRAGDAGADARRARHVRGVHPGRDARRTPRRRRPT